MQPPEPAMTVDLVDSHVMFTRRLVRPFQCRTRFENPKTPRSLDSAMSRNRNNRKSLPSHQGTDDRQTPPRAIGFDCRIVFALRREHPHTT